MRVQVSLNKPPSDKMLRTKTKRPAWNKEGLPNWNRQSHFFSSPTNLYYKSNMSNMKQILSMRKSTDLRIPCVFSVKKTETNMKCHRNCTTIVKQQKHPPHQKKKKHTQIPQSPSRTASSPEKLFGGWLVAFSRIFLSSLKSSKEHLWSSFTEFLSGSLSVSLVTNV